MNLIRTTIGHLAAHITQAFLEQIAGRTVQGLALGHDVDDQLTDDEAARMSLVEREAESEVMEGTRRSDPFRPTGRLCLNCLCLESRHDGSLGGGLITPCIDCECLDLVLTHQHPWTATIFPVAKGATEPAREVEATPDKPTSRAQTSRKTSELLDMAARYIDPETRLFERRAPYRLMYELRARAADLRHLGN